MLNLSINYLMSSVKINTFENDMYNTTAKSPKPKKKKHFKRQKIQQAHSLPKFQLLI